MFDFTSPPHGGVDQSVVLIWCCGQYNQQSCSNLSHICNPRSSCTFPALLKNVWLTNNMHRPRIRKSLIQCLTRDEYWFMQGWLLNFRWIIWQITIIMKSNGHTSFSLLHNTYSPCVIVAKTYCIVLIHFNLINIRNMWYFYCVHV